MLSPNSFLLSPNSFLLSPNSFLLSSLLLLLSLNLGLLLLFQHLDIGGQGLAAGGIEPQVPILKLKAHAQAGADPAHHGGDSRQGIALALPALQGTAIGVKDVIFFYPIPLVKPALGFLKLHQRIALGGNFKHHLGGNIALLPLLVGAAIALGATHGHHHIGGGLRPGFTFDGVPEQIPRHKDVGIVLKQGIKSALDHYNQAELHGVVGQWFTVALGINQVWRCRG